MARIRLDKQEARGKNERVTSRGPIGGRKQKIKEMWYGKWWSWGLK